MDAHTTLALALALNAVLGFGYRVYRLSMGGPIGDVVGQAILGVLLLALAGGVAVGGGWPRWPALVYGLLFGLVVMPLWTLAVLIPLSPGRADLAFTALYWVTLAVVVAASIAF
jgi:hypothetical protein